MADQSTENSIASLSEKGGQIRQNVGDMASIASGLASEKLGELKRGVSAMGRASLDKASHWQAEASDRVQRNPLTAVAVAVGLGAVLGFLMSRRH